MERVVVPPLFAMATTGPFGRVMAMVGTIEEGGVERVTALEFRKFVKP